MKNVLLRSEENVHGFKSFLVMGTNMSLGEENISRGRVGQVRWERKMYIKSYYTVHYFYHIKVIR